MNKQFVGILIKKERLAKNWSQEGLCRGICVVSYLSKIEQGRTDAGWEVIHLLLQRLGVGWHDDEETCRNAAMLADRAYEALFSNDHAIRKEVRQEISGQWEVLSRCPYLLDFMLLRAMLSGDEFPESDEFSSYFDQRQQTLWLLLKKRYEDALRLNPCAYTYFSAGHAAYHKGNYPVALERLRHCYDLAAEQGYVSLMLESRILMGNCYGNTMEFDRMQEHLRVAERLASALNDETALAQICYNTQSTNLELGRYRESYAYFSGLQQPNAMDLHKLAICCEKLGKTREALAALDRAEQTDDDFPPKDMARAMCALVRYRLEHHEYLKENDYGKLLLSCFRRIRKELPCGYAGFHLPWVMEWYTATRQYKQAYELLLDFPQSRALNHDKP